MSNLLVLAALLLLPAVPLDECEACRRSKVCTPHRNQDKAELKRLAPLLASKDAGQRMSALSVAAGLTEEHENAPGKEVAKVLASALADDQLELRVCVDDNDCSNNDRCNALPAIAIPLDVGV